MGFAAVALALSGALGGCGSDDASTNADSSGPVRVVATTTQMGDIVRQVGGPAVDVHQILSAGSDPHEYEPRPDDVAETANAKVVFASGLGLDDWASDVERQAGGGAPVVRVGDTVPTKLMGDAEMRRETGGDADPHWWHDPQNVERAVGTIRDAIVEADPDAKDAVSGSAAAYLAKVKALDAAIQRCIDRVPTEDRKLVTSHDAFRYFAGRYGIEVIGAAIPSQTTQAQASAGEVQHLISQIKAEGVRAIFPESSVNPKLADAIARETGASSDLTLYGDTLGGEGADGATYLGMERHNADAVVEGLTGKTQHCTPPAE